MVGWLVGLLVGWLIMYYAGMYACVNVPSVCLVVSLCLCVSVCPPVGLSVAAVSMYVCNSMYVRMYACMYV